MSDELVDFPEMDPGDISAATGIEPSAPGVDDDEPVQDGVEAAPVDDEPAAPVVDPANPNGNLPEYRQLQIANRELQARLDRLEQANTARNEPPPAAIVAPGEELSPEQKAVQEKFFKLFPAAKNLFEKADAILRAAEVAPNLASQAEEADNTRATSALKSVADSVATRILGAGKTADNLRPEARKRIAAAFATWAGADYATAPEKMPAEIRARALRYQNGDASLADDFAKDYVQDFVPVNRTERVNDAARARVASPRGGPSSAPPPRAPKQPDPDDEDALHGAAFASVRANAAAQ